ncbi:MAG: hypothetical protein GZ094_21450, partial [Mariniphaga sp.]|nr:hypothetical protein [Mariniphaga sp.]
MKLLKIVFSLLFLSITFVGQTKVKITKAEYQNRPQFKIDAKGYTAFFDIQGGGFSRLMDNDGNDWIAFKKEPWDKVPESAASSFRGLPNLVFMQEDGGCGHPGFYNCTSEMVTKNKIKTISKSGKWAWEWTFNDNFAELEIIKTDTSRGYWFLYEGPVGGKYDPKNCLWANNLHGFQKDLVSLNKSEVINGNWQWVSFGNPENKYVFSIVQENQDSYTDFFSWMGNSKDGLDAEDGMVVFGFGRDKKPLLKGTNKYKIGFQKI